MAEYTVELSPRGRADLNAVARDIALRIVKKLRALEENPFSRGDTVKRLQGFATPTYRLRIRDHRAIYRIRGAVGKHGRGLGPVGSGRRGSPSESSA